MQLKEIMTTEVEVVRPNSSIAEAAKKHSFPKEMQMLWPCWTD